MWFAKIYNPLQAGSIDGTDAIPHDSAVKRAQKAHYHPPKDQPTDPKKTLFVGRLNFSTTEEGLRTYFKQFGEITHVRLIYNVVTGTSQGYGFVTFEHERDARTAYDKAQNDVLDEHIILVDYERSRVMKGWVPRRLGGGFGGKKESGQLRFGARDKPFRWPTKNGRSVDHPEINISHDQRRSDNWRFGQLKSDDESLHRRRSESPRSRSPGSSLGKRRGRSSSRDRRKNRTSQSPSRKRKRSTSRHHRDRDAISPRRNYHRSDDRTAREYRYRDGRSSREYHYRDGHSSREHHYRDNHPSKEHHHHHHGDRSSRRYHYRDDQSQRKFERDDISSKRQR